MKWSFLHMCYSSLYFYLLPFSAALASFVSGHGILMSSFFRSGLLIQMKMAKDHMRPMNTHAYVHTGDTE